MERRLLVSKHSWRLEKGFDGSNYKRNVVLCSYLRWKITWLSGQEDTRFINIRRICQLILSCIRLNEISYQKSDRYIIWKFHCPNNFVSLFVLITGAPLYSRRDTNSWHMWPHYRYALERAKVIRDGFYVAAFSSVESALSLYFYLFGSFPNPDTVPRST